MAAIGQAITDLSQKIEHLLPRPTPPTDTVDGMSREDAQRMLRGMYRVKLIVSLGFENQKDTMYASTFAETPEEITTATADLARLTIERMLKGWITR